MRYAKLGNTDIEVSKICLGTMTFGEQNTEADGHEQMDYALEHGVNFFDTAELYAVPSTKENNGKTEEIIGTWFEKSGNRDKVILATKVTGPSKNLHYISDNLGFSRSRMDEAIEGSFKRLKTDYIDLYQLHWPERSTNFFGQLGYQTNDKESWKNNIDEVVNTMNDYIKDGKIRAWGLSNETPWGMMKYIHEAEKSGLIGPVSIQNPYSLLNRTYEVGMAEISMREQIGLLSYSPMAFGRLSGKFIDGSDRPEARLNKYKVMSRYNGKPALEATQKYYDLAKEHGLSLTQMALAFVNDREFMTSTIIGATTMDQLKENIASIDVILSNEVLKAIDKVHHSASNPAP